MRRIKIKGGALALQTARACVALSLLVACRPPLAAPPALGPSGRAESPPTTRASRDVATVVDLPPAGEASAGPDQKSTTGPSPQPESEPPTTQLAKNAAAFASASDYPCVAETRNPFAEITFDRVVAYSYPNKILGEGGSVSMPSGRSRLHAHPNVAARFPNGVPEPLRPRGVAQVELSKSQVDDVVRHLGDPKAYGGLQAGCFEPRHSLYFYLAEEMIGFVDICFECNFLNSTPFIATRHFHNQPGGDGSDSWCVPQSGFSAFGWKGWKRLCEDWGLGRCPAKEDAWLLEMQTGSPPR